MAKLLKLDYWETKNSIRPYSASVVNVSTGKSFKLADYGTAEKRAEMAPKLLAKKLSDPSSNFKMFIQKRADGDNKKYTIK